jgi:SAM-dependent methyltransferase
MGLSRYYARRAGEYEDIYRKPERQSDLRDLESRLSSAFAGLDVLEIACGTGYWTPFIARSARSIHAIDVNPEVLELARRKEYGECPVTFAVADDFRLGSIPRRCNAAFCGFWWSHIPLETIAAFLSGLHARLEPRAKVVLLDNRFVGGSSTPIARRDEKGNTFQRRRLKDGTEYEVLKNFPTEEDIMAQLKNHAEDIRIDRLTYYWLAEYESRG